jgi:hypothetical protein
MQSTVITIPAVTTVVTPASAALQLTLTPREAQFIASVLAHRSGFANGYNSSDGDDFSNISTNICDATVRFADEHVGYTNIRDSSLWHSERRRSAAVRKELGARTVNTTD